MTNLTTFKYLSKLVRVIEIDGQPWFAARDLCATLDMFQRTRRGYTEVNTSRFRDVVGDQDVTHIAGVGNGGTGLLFVSEAGLYRLVMRPDKPEARAFQDWVTREVLPAIRKDGMYVAGEEKLKTGDMDEDELTLLVMQRLRFTDLLRFFPAST
ncbi:BRO family protein [Sinorhizobium sp. BG8]|uniref:BRO-N domain-containing protein n=1 Tax=Sinorhizobium sp. BG8 TaxID=2613773 RepID=UPI00193DF479|nr:BRO family protein [Sinorhizobium sp. BG8]QRM55308.1 BRO domain-containing protein [Sinorhizobium sp. BG8]